MYNPNNKSSLFLGKSAQLGAQIGLVLMIAGAANAQSTDVKESRAVLEEVIVNARRTEENMQSVPISIVALSGNTLKEKTISSPEDLQVATPGVFLSGSGGRENVIYQIRGQSKALSGPSSPAVVSYFAEVPDPTFGSFVPQFDIASVQVLKGPQGTLFGRNTTGGAILYMPQSPTDQLEGSLDIAAGNYGYHKMTGVLNVPLLTDKAAIRIATDLQRRDPYTKNIGSGRDLDDIDAQSYRVSLRLDPIDTITNTLILDYYKSDNSGFATVLTGVEPEAGTLDLLGLRNPANEQLAAQHTRGPFKVDASFDQAQTNKRKGLTNRTEVDLGAVELVNIFGYRETALHYQPNVDGMPPIVTDGTGLYPAGIPLEYIRARLAQETKQTSNELQLRGDAFDNQLEWLVGGFWLKSEPNGSQGIQVAFAHIPGTPDPGAGYTFITEESQAVFTNLRYDLSDLLLDGLQLEVGMRYTKDSIEACTGSGLSGSPDEVVLSDCKHSAPNILNASTNTVDSSKTTWSVSLNWQINQDLFTYIITRRGYRAGGINGPTFAGRLSEFQSFAPETVNDIEIGVRTDWDIGDVTIRANASAFVGWYEDVQSVLTGVNTVGAACNPAITTNPAGISPDGDCNPNNDPNGGTMLTNIGESKVQGIDVELVVVPIENLTLSLAGNYLDPKTEKFNPAPALSAYISGNEIPFNNTAKKTFSASARYAMPLQPEFADELVLIADYYWSDELMYGETRLPSYNLTNIRIDLRNIAETNIDAGLFVRNLFDEEYQSGGQLSGGPAVGLTASIYGPPRMFGAEIRFLF
ncbi:MAG: TonB-dependent receptor [Spongiibacteraceae bacterium]